MAVAGGASDAARAGVAVEAMAPPRGWFAVAFASELRRGRVLTRTVNGHELVVFRTASGRAAALDPVCPHLGAHLGVGGRVVGEAVRCPFHGFRFDATGACTATGYGTAPPPGLAVAAWPVTERAGAVLVWSDPDGGGPAWEPPELDERGWSAWRTRRSDLRGHPHETTENAADLGHLAVVHGYDALEVIEPLRGDGPVLRAAYGMRRPFGRGPLRRLRRLGVRVRFDVVAHGLGYSLVHAHIPVLGVRTRQLVLATPVDRGRLTLRVALSARAPGADGGPLARRAGAAVAAVVARLAMVAFAHDVRQDEPIWEHKAHLPRPRLARGDGPVGPYRRWAAQFMTGATTGEGAASAAAGGAQAVAGSSDVVPEA